MQENYFNELEKKEQLEDKMKTITEIKVKVVCCKQVRKSFFIIFPLQSALWLVNLACRILLCRPLKSTADFVAKIFLYLLPSVLNFYSKNNFKTFFPCTLNCVFKLANDLTTNPNWLGLLSTSVNLKPFHVNRNRSRTRQTHSREIINNLLALGP